MFEVDTILGTPGKALEPDETAQRSKGQADGVGVRDNAVEIRTT